MGYRNILRKIFDSSPAEISVIEMTPGRKQFDILFVNKTKADNFGRETSDVIGRKCYDTFEALRTEDRDSDGHCSGCAAFEASRRPGKAVHREWPYIHPLKKQLRITSVTAQQIPNTTAVVEICRDCTVQKRVSELTFRLASARSYQNILDLVFASFLQEMYFTRCRFYEFCSEKNYFFLKTFKKAVIDGQKSYLRKIQDVPFSNVILSPATSYPDDQIIHKGLREPRFYYISDISNQRMSPGQYSKALTFQECVGGEDLDKTHHPMWIDLPLFCADKLIGKLSVDLEYQEKLHPLLEDHEIELLGILMIHVGQAWENVGLLNLKELLEIDELVLKSKGDDLADILNKILQSGLKFIGMQHSAICLPTEDDKLDIYCLDAAEGFASRRIPRKESYYAEIIHRCGIQPGRMLVLNALSKAERNMFAALSCHKTTNADISSCLVCPIVDDEGQVIGAWYLENQRPHFFTAYVQERVNLIAHQIALALKSVQQVKDLAEKSRAAQESKLQAEASLIEKEGFFRTMQHEIMAPIDPIMQTFAKFKRKIAALNLADKSLVLLAEDGIRHCQFMSYTFDNIDFVRSQKVELHREPAQIFKQVIIPVIQTVKEFARTQGVQLKYLGYQNVEKYIHLDINLMRNVFFNLLRNSIRYAHSGTTIYIIGEKSENNVSTILIEDNGIGIPKGWEKRIFELYERAENARNISSEGSGIGLYITKKIIQAHNGDIYVAQHSNPTRIAIKLPESGGEIDENSLDR
ncbi:GAF domain-containing protein [candidate division KSB1 bacterium]|nr:GAF domain-containing protein [candidate division KSB1 bacterium]RQW03498.1 MAG: GAF domain-containing protein [candidate division KSB1 bacterium]